MKIMYITILIVLTFASVIFFITRTPTPTRVTDGDKYEEFMRDYMIHFIHYRDVTPWPPRDTWTVQTHHKEIIQMLSCKPDNSKEKSDIYEACAIIVNDRDGLEKADEEIRTQISKLLEHKIKNLYQTVYAWKCKNKQERRERELSLCTLPNGMQLYICAFSLIDKDRFISFPARLKDEDIEDGAVVKPKLYGHLIRYLHGANMHDVPQCIELFKAMKELYQENELIGFKLDGLIADKMAAFEANDEREIWKIIVPENPDFLIKKINWHWLGTRIDIVGYRFNAPPSIPLLVSIADEEIEKGDWLRAYILLSIATYMPERYINGLQPYMKVDCPERYAQRTLVVDSYDRFYAKYSNEIDGSKRYDFLRTHIEFLRKGEFIFKRFN